MFYSTQILTRKGPLGLVWMAAHMDRGLRRNQVTETSIPSTVDVLLSPDAPLALRLSGQLLLGVCRIYSRKVEYLLQDCQDALVKIRLAFRPEQLAALTKAAAGGKGRRAAGGAAAADVDAPVHTLPLECITLPDDLDELQLLGADHFDARVLQPAMALEAMMAELQQSQGTTSAGGGGGKRRRASMGMSLAAVPTDSGAHGGYSLGLLFAPSANFSGGGAGGSGGGGAVDMEMEVFEDAGGPFQFDLEEVEIERLRAAPAAEAAGGGRQGAAELAALLGSGNLVPGGQPSMVDEDEGTGSPSSGLLGVVSRERESAGLSVGRRRSTAAAATTAAAGGVARVAQLGELLPDLGLDGGGDALDLEMDLGISEEHVDEGDRAGTAPAHSQGGSGGGVAAGGGPRGSYQADPVQTPAAGGIRRRCDAAAGSASGDDPATGVEDEGGDGAGGAASAAAHRVSALRAASFTADEIRAAAAAMMERTASADPYDIPQDPDAGGGAATATAVDNREDRSAEDMPLQDNVTSHASQVEGGAGVEDQHHVEACRDAVMDDGAAGLAAVAAAPAGAQMESNRRRGGPMAPPQTASQLTGAAASGAAAAPLPSGAAVTTMHVLGQADDEGGVDEMEVDGGVADNASQGISAGPGPQAGVRERGSEGGQGQSEAVAAGVSVGSQGGNGASAAVQIGEPAGSFGAAPSGGAPVELVTSPPHRMATRRSTAAAAAAAAAAAQAAAPFAAITEPMRMTAAVVPDGEAAAAQATVPQPAKAVGKRVKVASADGPAAAAQGKRRITRRPITVDREGVTIPAGHLREWLQDRSVLLDTTRLPGAPAGAANYRSKRRRLAAAVLPEEAAPAGMLHSWESAALGSWPPTCAVPVGERHPAAALMRSRRPAMRRRASLAPELRALFQVSVGQLAPQYALQMGAAAAAAHGGRLTGAEGLARGSAAAGAGSPVPGSPRHPGSWRTYLHAAAAAGLAGAGTPAAHHGTPPQAATPGSAGRGGAATPGSARHTGPSGQGPVDDAAGDEHTLTGGAGPQGRAGMSTPGASHRSGGTSRGEQHVRLEREGGPRMLSDAGQGLDDDGEEAQGMLPAASGQRASLLSERRGTPGRGVSHTLAAGEEQLDEFQIGDIEADEEGVYVPDLGGAGPSGGFGGSGAAAVAPSVSEVSFGHADSEKENCGDSSGGQESAPPGTGGKLPPSRRLSYGAGPLGSPLVRRPLAPQQNACAVALLASAGKTASVLRAQNLAGSAADTAGAAAAEGPEGDSAPGPFGQHRQPPQAETAHLDQHIPVSDAMDVDGGEQQLLQPHGAAAAQAGRRSVAGGTALGLEDTTDLDLDLDPGMDLGPGQGQGHTATRSQGTPLRFSPPLQRLADGTAASAGAHGLPTASPAPSQQFGTGLRQRSEAARQNSQELQQQTAAAAARTPVTGEHGGPTGRSEGLGLGSMLRPQQRLRWSNDAEDEAGRVMSQDGRAGSHRSPGAADGPDYVDNGGHPSGASYERGHGSGALTPFQSLLDQGAAGESGSGGMTTGHGSFPRLRSTSGETSCYGSGLSMGRGDSLLTRTLQELDVVARAVAAAAVAAVGPNAAGAESQQELLGRLPVRADTHDGDGDAGLSLGLGLLRHPFGFGSQQLLPSLLPQNDDGQACKVAGLQADAADQHPTQLHFEGNDQGQGHGTQQRVAPATQEAIMPATQQHQPGAAPGGSQSLPPWGEALLFASSAGGSSSNGSQRGCAAGAMLLSDLTRGRKRKDAARCFYDMLVLKSRGFLDLQKTAPPGGIPDTSADAAGVPTQDAVAGAPGQQESLGTAPAADPDEVPDVWVTLTQVGVEAACVRLLPGSTSQ